MCVCVCVCVRVRCAIESIDNLPCSSLLCKVANPRGVCVCKKLRNVRSGQIACEQNGFDRCSSDATK